MALAVLFSNLGSLKAKEYIMLNEYVTHIPGVCTKVFFGSEGFDHVANSASATCEVL